MSEWITFPFPKCPSCGKQWGENYHKDCVFNGQLLVEPYQRQVKCESCSAQWYILDSKFYCYCGYEFYPSEVEDALSTTQLLRQRLLQKLNEMDSYERSIVSKSQNSFKEWIFDISYEIGKALGITVSKAQEIIKNFFDKWSF
ncbi:hypothetical protein NG798_19880 [Ancylothrix sp. C2]|uniref:hypothetical protein n=1 Tax=Ancylothrix sp. D3o TaxID=2953691 RepID=UPI0021BBB001|nr:hypothetical protein [Ancylothrix sp. D3o]MCT7952062.1 hypothetical protein [Ancylothrix sp. D3o]